MRSGSQIFRQYGNIGQNYFFDTSCFLTYVHAKVVITSLFHVFIFFRSSKLFCITNFRVAEHDDRMKC